MDQLKQLRMRQHRQTMLQMVSEIHQGKLNITQAANKFSVTRHTVKTWLYKVEDKAFEHPVSEKLAPSTSKKSQFGRTDKDAAAQVDELMAKVSSLEEELDAAKFKAIYYSTLIQVAEQELGLDIGKKVRYQAIRFILMNYPTVQIRQLEEVLGVTRQGYYQYWKRQAGQLTYDSDVILLVNEIRRDHPRIGGRKLYSMIKENLNERGIKMGRDAFFNLLAINRLLVRSRRCKVKTTFPAISSESTLI